jgi:hypothetical protein
MNASPTIPLQTLDAAFEKVMATAGEGLSADGRAGHNHGVRLLRQRLGGAFHRNQAHHVTPQQLNACVDELQVEVTRQSAPSPDGAAPGTQRSASYWAGYAQGVTAYQAAIEQERAPTPTVASTRRRNGP